MNPQHLMPGNYILYNGKEVIVTPQLLITMQSPCKAKLFSPIELNEQWFLLFGFRKYFDYFDIGIFNVKYNHDNWIFENDITGFALTTIKYVHQLQILYFALTQKQLTK